MWFGWPHKMVIPISSWRHKNAVHNLYFRAKWIVFKIHTKIMGNNYSLQILRCKICLFFGRLASHDFMWKKEDKVGNKTGYKNGKKGKGKKKEWKKERSKQLWKKVQSLSYMHVQTKKLLNYIQLSATPAFFTHSHARSNRLKTVP